MSAPFDRLRVQADYLGRIARRTLATELRATIDAAEALKALVEWTGADWGDDSSCVVCCGERDPQGGIAHHAECPWPAAVAAARAVGAR